MPDFRLGALPVLLDDHRRIVGRLRKELVAASCDITRSISGLVT